jgi:hypothetical protein
MRTITIAQNKAETYMTATIASLILFVSLLTITIWW